jgi:hypothetical protein
MDGNAARERRIMGLLPQEGKFFDLFEPRADAAVGAALALRALRGDLSPRDIRGRAIRRSGSRADRIVRGPISCAAFISALAWWLPRHVL